MKGNKAGFLEEILLLRQSARVGCGQNPLVGPNPKGSGYTYKVLSSPQALGSAPAPGCAACAGYRCIERCTWRSTTFDHTR